MLSWTRRKLSAALWWALGPGGPDTASQSAYKPPGPHRDRLAAEWATDVAAGPLTRFSTGEPVHVCAAVCDPASPGYRPCFTQQPYVARKDREAGC